MSVEIVKSSKELSKKEQYLMTVAPSMVGINTLEDGTVIPVSAYLYFRNVKETGEVIDLLSIMDDQENVYVTSSDTFKNSFDDIADIFEGDAFSVKKMSGTSKAGRKYIVAYLA